MSPEQINNWGTDFRSDQFSFCVVAYEILYGVRPFRGKRTKLIKKAITKGEVPPPPKNTNVPGWIRRILLKGLAVDPDNRYRHLDALLDELQNDPTIARQRAHRFCLCAFDFCAINRWNLEVFWPKG